jgi:hypothetical protein
VGREQLAAIRVPDRHASRKLPPILDVEQHSRNQPRGFVWSGRGAERAGSSALQMVDRGQPALVFEIAHRILGSAEIEQPRLYAADGGNLNRLAFTTVENRHPRLWEVPRWLLGAN